MVYCCLGWGSLFWDPRSLPLCSDWHDDGPLLPVEFARQSADGRITLVVTPDTADIQVLWAELAVTSIEEARDALAEREGISSKYINRSVGCWSKDDQSTRSKIHVIEDWADKKGFAGVVWTALKPKFGGELKTPTSTDIMAYLDGLRGETRTKAEEYVRKTPKQIATPYRELIVEKFGWVTQSGP